jgi:hypothetical protein
MPKLKDAEVLNVKELEEAEYEEGAGFVKYDGEIPPTGTMVLMRLDKAWWTYSSNDDPMLKVLCVAEGNPEGLDEYDGLTAWENMVLTSSAKFKWDPFLTHFDLTIRDVRSKTMVDDEDDSQGAPITKIGTLVVGVISKEKYKGNWQAHIAEWLDPDTDLEAEEPEEEPEEKPSRSRSRSTTIGRAAKKPAAATGRGRSRRADPDEEEADGDEDESEEDKPSRSRTRKPAGRAAAKKPAASRGRSRRGSADDEEPPF